MENPTWFGRQLRIFERCPLCSIAKPSLEFRHRIGWSEDDDASANFYAWYIYQCTACGGPISAKVLGHRDRILSSHPIFDGMLPTYDFVPKLDRLGEEIPPTARRYLEQAIASVNVPDGAAMLANSAVDAMLQARGLNDGSVYKRLGEAVQLGILTSEMREWADKIRVESNNPRHADPESPHVTSDSAKLVVEFAKALAEVLFTLPAKAKAAAKNIEEADS